jgi:hypothetical protein
MVPEEDKVSPEFVATVWGCAREGRPESVEWRNSMPTTVSPLSQLRRLRRRPPIKDRESQSRTSSCLERESFLHGADPVSCACRALAISRCRSTTGSVSMA